MNIPVITNTFVVTALPKATFYHYDVFNPEIKQPLRAYEIIEKLQTIVAPAIFVPRAAYDGKKNLFASRRLFPDQSAVFNVALSDGPNPKAVVVQLSIVGDPIQPSVLNQVITGKTDPQRAQLAVTLLQTLVRQAPVMAQKTFNARSVFTSNETKPIGGGFDLWRGFFQSVRPVTNSILINVDISTGAVYSARDRVVSDWATLFIHAGSRGQPNIRTVIQLARGNEDWKRLKNALKHVKITAMLPRGGRPRIYTIKDLEPRAGFYQFDMDGKMTTISDYYKQKYGYALRYPELFGVVTRTTPHEVILPAEICIIQPGQLYKKKLPSHLMDEVLRFSAQPPQRRLDSILSGVAGDFLNYHGSDYVVSTGMQISTRPHEVMGRALEAPQIRYQNDTLPVTRGSWNLLGKKFFQPAALQEWVVADLSSLAEGEVTRFSQQLVKCCQTLEMVTKQPLNHAPIVGANVFQVLEKIMQLPAPPKLALFILPDNAAEIKKYIKVWGDAKHGVNTQCVRRSKVQNANNQYCNNLALKINTKLGGINSITLGAVRNHHIMTAPLMIVGADVGHAGPGMTQPSITSLVASHDVHFSKYHVSVELQQSRQEFISLLRPMMFNALVAFFEKNNNFTKPRDPTTVPVFPHRILFFRDGVSEGEYDKILEEECQAIEDAWMKFLRNVVKAPKPIPLQLTFIIVGKRHHIRFFPKEKFHQDKSGNFHPGLVVDKGIVYPDKINFYLQSHAGLKGTSRSGHYIILRDDNQLHVEFIQELSYFLCHVYARATKSVSIPAPVYYADLVCTRAAMFFPDLHYGSEGGSEDVMTHDTWVRGFKNIHARMRDGMFFI